MKCGKNERRKGIIMSKIYNPRRIKIESEQRESKREKRRNCTRVVSQLSKRIYSQANKQKKRQKISIEKGERKRDRE